VCSTVMTCSSTTSWQQDSMVRGVCCALGST
jgi:hypothetical protein